MTNKFSLFCQKHLLVLLCFAFVTTSLSWADEKKTQWPAEISNKERIHVYKKINPALKKMRAEKRKVSVGVFGGKLYRGDVIKVGKTKFTIVDYKGKQHTIKYNKIRTSYLSKIIPSKQQDGMVLHSFGLISLHEGEKKFAKIYFDRAIKQKYSKSKEYASRVADDLDSQREEFLALKEKEKQDELEAKEKAREEKKQSRLAKERSRIPNIKSLGSSELDVKANSFPGKYTIFKFGAPW
ncbi:hypothetical protein [Candidatus Uabimicrobium amorphum]|uniref:Uncharacterized protein n=1 Tax=Uabimicrobium amorphum TaxID=2596890 RepID=A0A5S9F346_UABAM|nr:hypothetical protein [Candidatus Uabimicrobium amorphum]BBM83881.1 hypothetical protein UABAM_02236 [Candidatus Uabimicrobium amorphum]